MKTKVQKWGNSLGLRIPRTFAQEARIDDGSSVDIKIEGEKLIIKSLRSSFNLEALLAQVTPQNIHEEIDTGQNIGKEVW
ncbi:MAG: AbrB/MazE/SpoVT family DNA-binding domain-containing protein [Deltaproteobacteria bacterium]|nr:MAG: AbrB/MazE/SpoVT family DNA-binding domain-containing protein [Deltaproteobacteria bacterium]